MLRIKRLALQCVHRVCLVGADGIIRGSGVGVGRLALLRSSRALVTTASAARDNGYHASCCLNQSLRVGAHSGRANNLTRTVSRSSKRIGNFECVLGRFIATIAMPHSRVKKKNVRDWKSVPHIQQKAPTSCQRPQYLHWAPSSEK